MNLKNNYELHLSKMIPLLFLLLVLNLVGCVRSCPILTQDEQIQVIPKGAIYTAIWDGKTQEFKAEQDRIAIAKGNYMELQKKADKCQ